MKKQNRDSKFDICSVFKDTINRYFNCIMSVCGECSPTESVLMSGRFTSDQEEIIHTDRLLVDQCDGIEDIKVLQSAICEDKDIFLLVKGEMEQEYITGRMKKFVTFTVDKESELFLVISNDCFCFDKTKAMERKVRVLAVIHFYNEADIIGSTIQYLLDQDVDLYLVDNWSSDGSYEIAEDFQRKYHDRIYLERFPAEGRSDDFVLYDQLNRTEEISYEVDYDWFIHYDADEIRISPWKDVSLRDAISYIDFLGYNGIENTVIDFRMVDMKDSIYPDGKYFDFRYKQYWINHLKTWKKTDEVDLKSTGGHYAHYKHPKIFPLHILNKHYPIRNLEQARKKVFIDRKPRFAKEKKQRGWHGHYDKINQTEDFIYSKEDLFEWDEDTFDKLYFQLFMEAGLKWEPDTREWLVPDLHGENIILYGAGSSGRYAYRILSKENTIIQWVDRDYEYLPRIFCKEIQSPDQIQFRDGTVVVIAVINEVAQNEIKDMLCSMGVPQESIKSLSDVKA